MVGRLAGWTAVVKAFPAGGTIGRLISRLHGAAGRYPPQTHTNFQREGVEIGHTCRRNVCRETPDEEIPVGAGCDSLRSGFRMFASEPVAVSKDGNFDDVSDTDFSTQNIPTGDWTEAAMLKCPVRFCR